jgi:hypothetical protein
MATCSYCKSTIVLGDVRSGDLHFCNTKCLRRESLPLVWTKRLPWVFLVGGLVIRQGYIIPTFMFLDALLGAYGVFKSTIP